MSPLFIFDPHTSERTPTLQASGFRYARSNSCSPLASGLPCSSGNTVLAGSDATHASRSARRIRIRPPTITAGTSPVRIIWYRPLRLRLTNGAATSGRRRRAEAASAFCSTGEAPFAGIRLPASCVVRLHPIVLLRSRWYHRPACYVSCYTGWGSVTWLTPGC